MYLHVNLLKGEELSDRSTWLQYWDVNQFNPLYIIKFLFLSPFLWARKIFVSIVDNKIAIKKRIISFSMDKERERKKKKKKKKKMVSTYENKTRSLFSSSRKKIPLRWKNPPWIPEHLSKSNFSKLIKLEKARIPSAVIASHFLKLNDVKFERPTEQGYNDYPRWPTKNPIFRNVKLVQKIIQVMMVETEVTSDKDKVVWFCFFFFFFLNK